MTIEEAFGMVIRRLRRERGCSQEKLSVTSYLDRTFISNIEGGKQQPSLVSIFALANALDVMPSYLILEVELILSLNCYERFRDNTDKSTKPWIANLENFVDKGKLQQAEPKTVLLADDEKQVREMLADVLQRCGYRVIMAEDGEDACNLYRQHMADITLVLMDVVMPRKNGIVAYHEIKQYNPGAVILLLSGYPNDTFKEYGELQILHKPFTPTDFVKQIRTLMSNG